MRRPLSSALPSLLLLFAAVACGPRNAAPAIAPDRAPAPKYVLVTSPALIPLERELRARIARDTAGEVAVALIDLATGHTLGIAQDVPMHAASTMKVPVMMELFRQAEAGRHRVDDSITVIDTFRSIADTSHYTLGSDQDSALVAGVGTRLSLRRIAHGMITVSSNLAANILIDYLTADSVRRTMAAIGAQDMVVLRGVSDDPAFRRGMNNTTTAAALARAMEVIARCSMHTRRSCDGMMAMLEAQQFRSEIPAGLPPGVRVGNKTGSITGHRHDAAIVMPTGRAPYVLVVLTRGAANPRAATAVAVDISRMVWETLGSGAAGG